MWREARARTGKQSRISLLASKIPNGTSSTRHRERARARERERERDRQTDRTREREEEREKGAKGDGRVGGESDRQRKMDWGRL